MLVYHGTNESFKKKNILKNGFKESKEDNLVGSGVYCTPNKTLAYEFTEKNYPPYRKDKRLVLTLDIDDSKVLRINYEDIAKICGYDVVPTEWSYSMDRIKGAREYCIENGYTGIEIIYLDCCSEICIFDKSIIKGVV